MKEVFDKYIGSRIGINIETLSKYSGAELVQASNQYIVVKTDDRRIHTIPYTNILSVVEDENGIEERSKLFSSNEKFICIVKIGHITIHSIG